MNLLKSAGCVGCGLRKHDNHSLEGARMGRLLIGLAILGLLPALVWAAPELTWIQTYEGGGNYIDDVNASLTDTEGNLIIAGVSSDGVDGIDMLICKMDRSTGSLAWERRVSSEDPLNDMAVSGMVWDEQGDLLVGGYVVGCEG
jgi:hypothetical protein